MREGRARPYGLVAGRDGGLWIALFGTNNIGRIDPANGTIRLFPIPDSTARPRRLVVDAQGIVWFTDNVRGHLGRLDPKTGAVRLFPSPGGAGSGPYGIAIAPDGRIWYDEGNNNQIVTFDPRTQAMTTVAIPTPGATVRNMTVDSIRARLWLALSGTGRIGRIDLGTK